MCVNMGEECKASYRDLVCWLKNQNKLKKTKQNKNSEATFLFKCFGNFLELFN